MIAKSYSERPRSNDKRQQAGADAERQMAHYLHRAFAHDPEVRVLHDLRLVDPEQPEHHGGQGACQIDHLILHRWGAFIVESKSVHGVVSVRDDGGGGDEWTRQSDRQPEGIPSPIQQARRQAEFLRRFLQRHRERLLGKMPVGLRTIARLKHGDDQRGFLNMPIQIIVAFSDSARIERIAGWEPPKEPVQTFVCKADTVADKIQAEVCSHRAAGSLLGKPKGEYGMWSMAPDEVVKVADFLARQHTPSGPGATRKRRTAPEIATVQPATPPPPAASAAACKHCGGAGLSAHGGRYGYYWKCDGCGKNTPMPTTCGLCGAERSSGETVRIRKEGPRYFRSCEKCGIDECIWIAK